MELILQNLQESQYQYPEKAFIRETASNCTDSIDEKSVARNILTGKAKVEDYYSTEVDKLSKDSQFDPNYYDLKFLNPVDEIKIIYQNKDGHRDKIIISDTGVGLGGKRLQGYMRPAYSTKRLSKKALGKYGVGSKSGLSTGVESYQMTSCHNGKKFSFDIYSDRYFSTIPKFNDYGEVNPHEIWKVKKRLESGEIVESDEIIYYEITSEYNSVTTSIDVKNPVRKKHTYFEAIKTQLAYFDNITFIEIDVDGYERKHNFKAEILYRDEHIIIPKEKYYTVPHIVLNNVIYGPADYAEMELIAPQCSVGFILDPSSVDVNHAREAVRWTDKTRDSILNFNELVKDIAFNYLAKEISESTDNFITWLKACKDVRVNNINNNTVLNRLSGMVDTSSVDFEFPGTDGKVKFSASGFKTMFKGFNVTKTIVNKSEDSFTTNTVLIKEWSEFSAKNLLFRSSTEVSIKSIKMGYITENILDEGNAVYLITPDPKSLEGLGFVDLDRTRERMRHIKSIVIEANNGLIYDDIEPTEEFLATYLEAQKKKEEKERVEKEQAEMTAAEIRKRDGKLLVHYVVHRPGQFDDESTYGTTKDEIEIDDVGEYYSRERTIYFHKNDLPLVKALLHIFPNDGKLRYNTRYYGNKKLDLIMVAQDAAKFVNQHAVYVKEAIQTLRNNTLIVMNPIQKYITGRIFRDAIKSIDFTFLSAFEDVDNDVVNVYNSIATFANLHGDKQEWTTKISGSEEVAKYFDNLTQFQIFVATETDKSKVSDMATQMFGNSNIQDCKAINMEKYAEFKALEDYITPIKGLLRGINASSIDKNELREYLKFKGVSKFSEYLKERYDEFNIPVENRTIN
ncbi:ATP-binding protein [Tenacibaculum sp.]|uniref:ATP-binding protein n=1 Tax=Tenacibaculum sp. TaxID=1906242 RepID=UPI003D0BB33F